MQIISKEHAVYQISANNQPVITVDEGEVVRFITCDCFSDQIASANCNFSGLDWNRINPATGPVFINGAKPGDILQVHIKNINITRDYGVMITVPDLGIVGDKFNQATIDIIPVKNGKVQLPNNVNIDIKPMIGVIGVAPASEAISCGTPGSHGGNMDCKVITTDSILYLPVNVSGALFALGDLHAAMGDGEVSVCGLEIAGEVDVQFNVIKQSQLPTPMLENAQSIYTIASALTLDEAANLATRNMVDFLVSKGGLSYHHAISLLSAVGDLQICQIVDPLKTCRFALAKSVLEQLNIKIK